MPDSRIVSLTSQPHVSMYILPAALFIVAGSWAVLMAGLALLSAATAWYGIAGSAAGLQVASALHGVSLSLIHVASLSLLAAFPLR